MLSHFAMHRCAGAFRSARPPDLLCLADVRPDQGALHSCRRGDLHSLTSDVTDIGCAAMICARSADASTCC